MLIAEFHKFLCYILTAFHNIRHLLFDFRRDKQFDDVGTEFLLQSHIIPEVHCFCFLFETAQHIIRQILQHSHLLFGEFLKGLLAVKLCLQKTKERHLM